jgi:hypothetical protein
MVRAAHLTNTQFRPRIIFATITSPSYCDRWSLLSKPQQYRSLQLSLLSISSSDYHSLCTSSSRIPLLSAATTSTTFTVTCAGAATIHDQPTTHHIPARVATTTTSESEHSKLYKASGRIMDKSPFDKLPLELRLDIYERVLHVEDGLRITLDNKPSKYQRSHTKNADRRPTRSSSLQKNLLAIRATCKEVYLETDGIVSSVNNSWTFVHCEDNTTAWGKRARRWLLLAGPEAQRRVRSVQFDLGVWTKQQRNIHSRADDAPREAIDRLQHQVDRGLDQRHETAWSWQSSVRTLRLQDPDVEVKERGPRRHQAEHTLAATTRAGTCASLAGFVGVG